MAQTETIGIDFRKADAWLTAWLDADQSRRLVVIRGEAGGLAAALQQNGDIVAFQRGACLEIAIGLLWAQMCQIEGI